MRVKKNYFFICDYVTSIIIAIIIIIILGNIFYYFYLKDTIIYNGTVEDRQIIALAIYDKTGVGYLYPQIAEYNNENSLVLVYRKKYKQCRYAEPFAVFEKGSILYYNPLYEWDSSPYSRSIKDVINKSKSDQQGVIANIYRNYRLEAKDYLESDALITVRRKDLGSIRYDSILDKDVYNEINLLTTTKIDKKAIVIIKQLNDWMYCDIGYNPAKVVLVPKMNDLPSSLDEIFELLPSNHRHVLEESKWKDLKTYKDVKRFNPIHDCYYHEGWGEDFISTKTENIKKLVRDHFFDLEMDIVEGKGYNDVSYPFEFKWIVMFDNEHKLLYSFLLNLQD